MPITPRSPWRLVFRQGDLAYMTYAGTTGLPGSYYLRSDELVETPTAAAERIGPTTPPVTGVQPQLLQPPQTAVNPALGTGGYINVPQTLQSAPAIVPGLQPGSVPPQALVRGGVTSGYIDPPAFRPGVALRTPVGNSSPPAMQPAQVATPAATSRESSEHGGAVLPVLLALAGAGLLVRLLWKRSKPTASKDTPVVDLPPRHQTVQPRPETVPVARTSTQAAQPRSTYRSTSWHAPASSPLPPGPRRAGATQAAWHPPGQGVTVAGHAIEDGMVYVGSYRSSSSLGSPCFIDPGLPIATSNPDTAGTEMGYWPSYSHIPPRSRLAYLKWLAGGKRDPAGYIGYVFLYFYGLERRLFVDRADEGETDAIAAEVERLRSIYGANKSFSGYSRGLLDTLDLRRLTNNPAALAAFEPDLQARAHSMPLPLKLAIASRVVQGQPLTFETAMAGVIGLGHDAFPVDRKVLEHARPQLLAMMRPVFDRAFPAGFNLRNRKNSRLELQHRCATAGLVVDLAIPGAAALPDPATLTWNKLVALVIPVAAELEAYGKLVAHHPARAASLAALSSLPQGVQSTAAEGPARRAVEWLQSLAKPIAAVKVNELAERTLGSAGTKWTPKNHRTAAAALAASRYGIEPAILQGLTAGGDAIVYLFPDPDASSPRSPAYQAAAVGAEVVSAMGRLNPAASQKFEEVWLQSVSGTLRLEAAEHTRLAARLRWLSGTKTSLARIKTKLADTSLDHRRAIAWSAATAAAAAAGGMAAPAQVAVLEKVYDQLGLERRDLYATLHGASARAAVAADEPVTVATGTGEAIYAIPPAPAAMPAMPGKAQPGPLDEERLQRIRAETERVSAVLADVFAEETEETVLPAELVQHGEAELRGLDGAHAGLVHLLVTAASWSRVDFEAAAKSCGLFPDGALEAINEWAFDRFDEPLIEDGDLLLINAGLLDRSSGVADAA